MVTADEHTTLERKWVIHAYHVYKDVWTAAIGKVLYNYYYKKIFHILVTRMKNFQDEIKVGTLS